MGGRSSLREDKGFLMESHLFWSYCLGFSRESQSIREERCFRMALGPLPVINS